ncbi:hypothetical protein NC651_039165 [Populus alba x Populus x berolinensis]|nr:hypothetical protein NC651_039165 [Populus alba x Populus x berolinensis]
MFSCSHQSTFDRLYAREKKLYQEVRQLRGDTHRVPIRSKRFGGVLYFVQECQLQTARLLNLLLVLQRDMQNMLSNGRMPLPSAPEF